jgi:hypothetical protein
VNENMMVGTAMIPLGMRRSLTTWLGRIGKSEAVTRTVSDGHGGRNQNPNSAEKAHICASPT